MLILHFQCVCMKGRFDRHVWHNQHAVVSIATVIMFWNCEKYCVYSYCFCCKRNGFSVKYNFIVPMTKLFGSNKNMTSINTVMTIVTLRTLPRSRSRSLQFNTINSFRQHQHTHTHTHTDTNNHPDKPPPPQSHMFQSCWPRGVPAKNRTSAIMSCDVRGDFYWVCCISFVSFLAFWSFYLYLMLAKSSLKLFRSFGPKGGQAFLMSAPLSGISGLSFDSIFLSAFVILPSPVAPVFSFWPSLLPTLLTGL